MSSVSSVITVPKGMSPVNALYALWASSKSASIFSGSTRSAIAATVQVLTSEKVAELFQDSTDFNYVGGRMLKVDFSNFPKLNVRLYDREFGKGKAKQVIDEYNKLPSSERFDQNDFYKFKNITKL